MTHPFHPLQGCDFDVITCRQAWGEDRVYFYDADGVAMNLPVSWTDLSAADPFVVLAAGRSLFRIADLVDLRRLLTTIDTPASPPALDV